MLYHLDLFQLRLLTRASFCTRFISWDAKENAVSPTMGESQNVHMTQTSLLSNSHWGFTDVFGVLRVQSTFPQIWSKVIKHSRFLGGLLRQAGNSGFSLKGSRYVRWYKANFYLMCVNKSVKNLKPE